MKAVNGLEMKLEVEDSVNMQYFSKNVGRTVVRSIRVPMDERKGFYANYYPQFKVLSIGDAPKVWFAVDSYESALAIAQNLSGPPMLTKKALEYANRDIENESDKLMPTNKTIAWKNRDRGDRPTCPGHPG